MGKYIEWDDVVDRYPEIDSLSGSDELSPTYITYAEAYTEAALSGAFTPPFSSNNLTIRDLCIDCTYFRAGRGKLDNADAVKSDWFATIQMLTGGTMSMVTTSGAVILSDKSLGAYSSTQSYSTSFGFDAIEDWEIDCDHQQADYDART